MDSYSTIDALPQATDWVRDLKERTLSSGPLLSPRFRSFLPHKEVEPVTFFGPEAADMLVRLKRRVESGDMFFRSFLSPSALSDGFT